MMFKNMLLPHDGSSVSERAVPFALHLASAIGARLILMHGRVPLATPRAPDFDVEGFAMSLRESEAVGAIGVPRRVQIDAVAPDVPTDGVPEGICATATEQQADLIVMSTHGHGRSGHSLYGSVAERVLCQSPVPVVLVPASTRHAWLAQPTFRILVPLDGSRFAEEVLGPIEDLAAALKAELFLVGAVEALASPSMERDPLSASAYERELGEMRQYLDGVADRLRESGIVVRTEVEVGRAASVIDGIAQRRHIDLIAMATHGRRGLNRLLVGSVADKVLRGTIAPLLLYRSQASKEHS